MLGAATPNILSEEEGEGGVEAHFEKSRLENYWLKDERGLRQKQPEKM